MPRPYRSFAVVPSLPEALRPLNDIAYNLWWSWHRDGVDLFRRLDRDLWESTHHNPVQMLGRVSQERLEQVADDDGFIGHMERVARALRDYLEDHDTWFERRYRAFLGSTFNVAYFSMEFGLTDCVPIYSGGMGILAGDHLKSCSDLGIPLVGVSLLYQQGYFQQYLNADGWQGETYPINDFANMPLQVVRDEQGAPRTVQVEYPGRTVTAQIWRAIVGRAQLYFLDANLSINSPEDRAITERLYGGDVDMRIRQEVLLGIGGYRALRDMGLRPTICHMNEGHSAFLALERARMAMVDHGLTFEEARQFTSAANVFTTHTAVPAGIDLFSPSLMERYFRAYAAQLGLGWDDFLQLGRAPGQGGDAPFSMAVLALSLSGGVNGVSKIHGDVARRMWQSLWPGLPASEVPISVVTNGIHHTTWVSRDMAEVFATYCGPDWYTEPEFPDTWRQIDGVPDEELWRAHERRRNRLVSVARQRMRRQAERRGASYQEASLAATVLDRNALTIGFARRFATYKRALLLFRDPDRLARLVNNPERPVQIIISGKAHPQDQPAKELIRQLVHLCRLPELQSRVIFLENYDLEVARYLVQGVDVWLNTPLPGQEASGTSGMKACMNGVLHLSTMDGWWAEGYVPEAGWRIGNGEVYADSETGDQVEARALYDLLEKDVIPLFYQRGVDGVPHGWVAMMKRAIRQMGPAFNTHRMAVQYVEQLYLRGSERRRMLAEDGYRGTRDLAAALARLRRDWGQVRVVSVESDARDGVTVRTAVRITAHVTLGTLTPDDVIVQVAYGRVEPDGALGDYALHALTYRGPDEHGDHRYEGDVTYPHSGQSGYTVRVLPHHPLLGCPYVPGLIQWAS